MKNVIVMITLALAVISVIAAFAWSILGSRAEQASYDVVKTDGDVELRNYPPMIFAEVQVSGERELAINSGFRQLAAYIFGDNKSTGKIAMTAPVLQQSNEKIAMTAPVMQSANGQAWTVTFKMPDHYKRDELPVPNNTNIHIKEVPAKHYAVIRFSGIATREAIAAHQAMLEDYVKSHAIATRGPVQYAFFNPPYTLPFLRRNEIMIEITSKPSSTKK